MKKKMLKESSIVYLEKTKKSKLKNNTLHKETTKELSNFYKVYFKDSLELLPELLEDYSQKFQLIYLDPPYNTKRSRGSRKSYTDNSLDWSNSIKNILSNSHKLLRDEGFLVLSINQMELFNLKQICDKIFTADCFIGLFPVKIRHTERQLMINATYHDVYEYLLFYRKNKKTRFNTEFKGANVDKFIYSINIINDEPKQTIIAGKKVEIYNEGDYEIVTKSSSLENLRRYIIAGKLATANWSGEFFEKHLRKFGKNKLIKVEGLEKEGLGYRWFLSHNDKRNSGVYFQSAQTAGRPILPSNDLDYTEIVPNIYKEGGKNCDFKDSKKPEHLLNFIINICSKKNDLVGDFFGGSGTTISTCIKTKRSCITNDNNAESFKILINRLNNLKNGKDIDGIKYDFNYEV